MSPALQGTESTGASSQSLRNALNQEMPIKNGKQHRDHPGWGSPGKPQPRDCVDEPSNVPELQMLGKSFQVLQSSLECFVTCKISLQSQ